MGSSSSFASRNAAAKQCGSVSIAGVGATFFVSTTCATSSFDQSSGVAVLRDVARARSAGSNSAASGRTASDVRSTIMYSSSIP